MRGLLDPRARASAARALYAVVRFAPIRALSGSHGAQVTYGSGKPLARHECHDMSRCACDDPTLGSAGLGTSLASCNRLTALAFSLATCWLSCAQVMAHSLSSGSMTDTQLSPLS